MPELPEVQTVVNTVRPRVIGQRIRRVQLLRTDIIEPSGFDLPAAIARRTLGDVSRRGKRIIITLDDGNRFFIHLGMTGRLTIESPGAELVKHTHLVLHFGDFNLHFRDPRRFGGIFWLGRSDPAGTMGPEPLTVTPTQLAARLARTSRAIKNVLMDQTVVAGLGNIYVDESLFAARIHPLRAADRLKLDDVKRLNRAIKSTLRGALRHRGSTLRDYVDADGGRGAFQNLHQVYDRATQPCRICESPIERIVLGGRSTCYCPTCQKSG